LAPATGGIEMFDKLVESDTAGAEFKNRSRYFLVSTVIVGILFLTAVVYSLYAADIGIGTGNLEIAELISPVAPDVPEPDPPHNQPQSNESSSTPRNIDSNMARTDEPTIVPISTSAVQNHEKSRGWEKFNRFLPLSDGSGSPTGTGPGSPTGTSANIDSVDKDEIDVKATEPPPVIKKPAVIKSEGVINGKATYLPIPPYPAPAKAVNAFGTVNVQVTIDELGNVISAKAIDGHPFLRPPAEKAAKAAKFSPTYLSKVAVKVTGVIVYNFKRN
jgi:protein TonB